MNTTEHLLTKLIEECSEVIKDASKALIFGLDDHEPGQNLTNREKLTIETSEVIASIEMLEASDLIGCPVLEVIEDKKRRVIKWMNYAREKGTLID